jgi:hypothetical protein
MTTCTRSLPTFRLNVLHPSSDPKEEAGQMLLAFRFIRATIGVQGGVTDCCPVLEVFRSSLDSGIVLPVHAFSPGSTQPREYN